MVMMPMEGTDNGDLTGDDNTMEIRRKRRSIFTTQMHNIESVTLGIHWNFINFVYKSFNFIYILNLLY